MSEFKYKTKKTQTDHVNHLLDLLLIGLLLGALELLHNEVGEVSSLRQQLRVAPALRNLGPVKHANTKKQHKQRVKTNRRIMRSKDVKLIPLKAFPHRSILQNYDLVHLRQEANSVCHQNPLSITALQYSFSIKVLQLIFFHQSGSPIQSFVQYCHCFEFWDIMICQTA